MRFAPAGTLRPIGTARGGQAITSRDRIWRDRYGKSNVSSANVRGTMKEELKRFLEDCHRSAIRQPLSPTDRTLSRARAGDARARLQVLNANRELAAILALRLKPPKMRAEDAVQEALLLLEDLVLTADDRLEIVLAPAIRDHLLGLSRPAREAPRVRRGGVELRPKLRRTRDD
jgi:hypothetical protein